jgi:hypothetical protein
MDNTVGAKLSKIGAENPDFLQAVCTTVPKKDPARKDSQGAESAKRKNHTQRREDARNLKWCLTPARNQSLLTSNE